MIDILCMLVLGWVAWWSTTDSVCLSLVIHQTLPYKVPGIKHKRICKISYSTSIFTRNRNKNGRLTCRSWCVHKAAWTGALGRWGSPAAGPPWAGRGRFSAAPGCASQGSLLHGNQPNHSDLVQLTHSNRYRTWTCAYLTAFTGAGLKPSLSLALPTASVHLFCEFCHSSYPLSYDSITLSLKSHN